LAAAALGSTRVAPARILVAGARRVIYGVAVAIDGRWSFRPIVAARLMMMVVVIVIMVVVIPVVTTVTAMMTMAPAIAIAVPAAGTTIDAVTVAVGAIPISVSRRRIVVAVVVGTAGDYGQRQHAGKTAKSPLR
jgi:hypothetical protein